MPVFQSQGRGRPRIEPESRAGLAAPEAAEFASAHLSSWFAVMLASGCAPTNAYRYGSGAFALNGAECNQTDSTFTCCLKQNPGQYERCGATPPAQSEPINVGPPGLGSLEAAEQGESKDEKRKRCLPDYVACIDKLRLKPGGLSGTSQCQDCYDYCVGNGFWPLSMNKKPCPGVGR